MKSPGSLYDCNDQLVKKESNNLKLIDPQSIGNINKGKETENKGLGASELTGKAGTIALDAALGIVSSPLRSFPGLLQTLQVKDNYTRWHVKRVAEISSQLAKELKLSPVEVKRVEKAAVLHDVGKILTPDKILGNQGPLDDKGWKIMKRHVTDSVKLLSGVTGGVDDKVKEYVGAHHERWDGKGYPKGLKGDQIPLGAQIIAIADTYDAITTDRSYQKGRSKDDALSLMSKLEGQHNPKVLKTFLRMMGYREN
ncbi:MAG: HD domain-containing protein [Candidatus Eremiobacteraeota bacterium]|nr:HD domain-containing protein [Candidatus Eremiobacteraeota bacterium]